MEFAEIEDKVYKLNDQQITHMFFQLMGWMSIAKDNAEYIKAMETFLAGVKFQVKEVA